MILRNGLEILQRLLRASESKIHDLMLGVGAISSLVEVWPELLVSRH